MLPLVPIVFLAYAVLYAFAQPIRPGFIEQSVQDAIAIPRSLPVAMIDPVSTPASDLVKREELPTIHISAAHIQETGENKGFFHECKTASPSCSEG